MTKMTVFWQFSQKGFWRSKLAFMAVFDSKMMKKRGQKGSIFELFSIFCPFWSTFWTWILTLSPPQNSSFSACWSQTSCSKTELIFYLKNVWWGGIFRIGVIHIIFLGKSQNGTGSVLTQFLTIFGGPRRLFGGFLEIFWVFSLIFR